MAFLSELDEVQREVGVRKPGSRSRAREAGLRVQVAVRVDVDDVRLERAVEPQVDAAIVTALERFESRARDVDAALGEGRGQLDEPRRALDANGRFGVPLRLVRDDARLVGEGRSELNLGERQRATAGVAQERNVDFATVDVLLDQRRLVKRTQHAADGFAQARSIVNHRVEVDADRSVFTRRLHDERKRQLDADQFFDARDDDGGWRGHSTRAQNFFRLVLVQRERERQRRRTGEGEARELEHRGHQRFTAAVSAERLAQIHDDVRLARECVSDRSDVVDWLHFDAPFAATKCIGHRGSDIHHVGARLPARVFFEQRVIVVVQNRDEHRVGEVRSTAL